MPDILPAVDSSSLYRLPTKTRNQLASDLATGGTPEGNALAAKFAQTGNLSNADSVESVAILGTVSTEAANPETELNSAITDVVEDVLGGGVSGLQKTVDARADLSSPRPAWAGVIVWLINVDDDAPLHVADGDMVWQVAEESVPIPFTPAALPNLSVWLDAQALGLADGAAVASWADLSGNGNTFVQGGSTQRPVVDIDKINGHPAVVSDGSNDSLVCSAIAPAALTGPVTLYVVGGTDLADNTSGTDFFIGSGNSADSANRFDISRDTSERILGTAIGGVATSAASVWTTGVKLIKFVVNGANSQVWLDGTSVATASTVSALELAKMRLFARYDNANFFPGFIGELVLVGGTVSAPDEAELITYLETRWGL